MRESAGEEKEEKEGDERGEEGEKEGLQGRKNIIRKMKMIKNLSTEQPYLQRQHVTQPSRSSEWAR